ncbi:hypothetical protein SL053_002492, partial [Flavobacterium psychrophilum]|nr:hypothetical protein [Flavobacterium psychrophilum]
LPLEGQRLKPIAYKRNYEELIGLFNTDNSGSKDLLTNYENKFIDKYKEKNDAIKDIVDGFSEYLCEDNRDLTIDEVKAKVIKSAKKLWKYAVWQHKDHTSTIVITTQKTGEKKEEIKEIDAIADDRPLYWARIAMQVILKRQYVFIEDIKKLPQKDQDDFFIKSIVPKSSKLWKAIQLFEENSRNYIGIDFSKAGGKKKVLITGFDPFLLNSIKHPNWYNILQSNPSGVVALALANDDKLGAYIQTMVVPVRYTDFDGSQEHDKGQGEGIIEKYIKPFINQVDMIITISQYLENENVIDMFGTSRRGGFNDNMDFIRKNGSQAVSTKIEWIQTTLPKTFIKSDGVKINWKFDDISHIENTIPKKEQILIEGSGGNYLSNEIFYRVGRMRSEMKHKLATGHFHIEKIQDESIKEDLKTNEMINLITLVKKGVEEGIKGL